MKKFDTFLARLEKISPKLAALASMKADRKARLKEIEKRASEEKAEALGEEDPKVRAAETDIAADVEELRDFAIVHREEILQDKKKSADLSGATVGFEVMRPKVGFTDEAAADDDPEAWVIAKLEKAGHNGLVKTSKRIDRTAVQRAELSEKQLAAVGIEIVTGEEFFVSAVGDRDSRVKLPALVPES